MDKTAFDLIGRYFWLICVVISGYQYYAASRRVTGDLVSEPLRMERTRYMQWFIGGSTLPWLVMGLGQLTGSTSSVWDYFRPQDMNVFVLGFVGYVFVLSLAMAYWVFFKDGARKAVDLRLMEAYGFAGRAPLTERQVRLFAGFGPLFIIAWIALCIYLDAPIRR